MRKCRKSKIYEKSEEIETNFSEKEPLHGGETENCKSCFFVLPPKSASFLVFFEQKCDPKLAFSKRNSKTYFFEF